MSYHYEIIMQYYREGKIEDAVNYFEQYKELLPPEDAEKIKEMLPDSIDLIYEALENQPKFLLNLYYKVKEYRKWNDDDLCGSLRISKEDLRKITSLVTTSRNVRDKIFNEYLDCWLEKHRS